MIYWYDTEFAEDGERIDLISIGVVAEDGRIYYAINKDCDFAKANRWVKENVFPHLPPIYKIDVLGAQQITETYRSKSEIRDDLLTFIGDEERGWTQREGVTHAKEAKPQFWGYYSAYDHVVLCQLFGAMVNLPPGWPMYTRDIKQLCDELGNPTLPPQTATEHHALVDAQWNKAAYDFLQSQRPRSRK